MLTVYRLRLIAFGVKVQVKEACTVPIVYFGFHISIHTCGVSGLTFILSALKQVIGFQDPFAHP